VEVRLLPEDRPSGVVLLDGEVEPGQAGQVHLGA
jgi:hypothetical protein